MTMHPSITYARVHDALHRQIVTLDNPGFCKACGADADGCEPDAQNYICELCGEAAVFGAFEIAVELF